MNLFLQLKKSVISQFLYFGFCQINKHMPKLISLVLIFSSLFFLSCDSNIKQKHSKSENPTHLKKDLVLDKIIQDSVLRAATDYGSVSYLIYRGETIGYQYELLKELTKYLGVELELIIEKSPEKSIEMLNDGEIDLMAMGLTITNDRKEKLLFTDPIMTSEQVLVQRLPDGYQKMKTRDEIESYLIRNQIELADKTVNVQAGTVFPGRLKTLADEIGDTIHVIEEEKDVEELIAAVASGEIDFTIADKHIGLVNARYYNNLDVKTPISFPQRIAWAVKMGQNGLVDTINVWLDEFNKSLLSRLLYNKYFENLRSGRIARSKYSSFSGGRLSQYDDLIQEASEIVNWDWRLLASVVYQESEFKPKVRSWVGAYGLMQMMPKTLEKYGLDTTATPKQQLIAGAKYLKHLDGLLPEDIENAEDRIKFTLASYNSGLGHVLDARRLAEKYGRDPNTWNGNVDHFIRNLSDEFYYHDTVVYYGYLRGEETYNFVIEILARYEDYKNLIKE